MFKLHIYMLCLSGILLLLFLLISKICSLIHKHILFKYIKNLPLRDTIEFIIFYLFCCYGLCMITLFVSKYI